MAQPVPSAVTVVGTEQSMATSNGPLAAKSVTAGKVMTQDAVPSAEPFAKASLESCDAAPSEVEDALASSADVAASSEGPREPDPSSDAAPPSATVVPVERSWPTGGGASPPEPPPQAAASTTNHGPCARMRERSD